MKIGAAFHSRIYRDFMALTPKDYHGIIRFFEQQEERIRELEFGEYFELFISYTDALFEVGAYRQHLAIVDEAIEVSIDEKVAARPGTAIFRRMLFRKAASLFHCQRYPEAEYVIEELIRMDARDEDAIRFLRKARRKQQTRITGRTRASAIFLYALSALVITVEVLLVRPFFDIYTDNIEWTRNFIFFLGWLSLGTGELLSFLQAYRYSQRFVKKTEGGRRRAEIGGRK